MSDNSLAHLIMMKCCRYLFSVVVIILIVFLLPRMLPGDPVVHLVGEDIYLSPDEITDLRTEFGLNKSLPDQFVIYCSDLFRGDLGYSYHLHGPVIQIMINRMGWTLLFVGTAIGIGAIIGTVLGAYAGWFEGRLSGILTALSLAISATPPYLLGLLFLTVFVYHLGLFPFKGLYDTFTIESIIWHLALPVSALSLFLISRNLIIMQGSVISEKNLLYPQFARSLGIPSGRILRRHIMKNASLPVITLLGLDFGFLFSGALFIEIIFSLYGMGTLMYEAIQMRDYPILTGSFLLISLLVIIVNAGVDLISGVIDPRVRSER